MINQEKLVKNYFTKNFPKKAIILAVLGLLFWNAGVIGILLLLAAAAWLALGYFMKKTATDREVDELIQAELDKLTQRGLDKFGLVQEEVNLIDPIVIRGPHNYAMNKDVIPLYRRGDDNELRYSLIKGVVFYFSENQVYSYTCIFDIITGQYFTETTDEYFYRDIVSVSTAHDRVEQQEQVKGLLGTKVGQSKLYDIEKFILTTSGGTSISATIKDQAIIERYKGNMSIQNTEDKIRAMRNLLRERKAV